MRLHELFHDASVLDIPRDQMPQVSAQDLEKSHRTKKINLPLHKLIPVQSERVPGKVSKTIQRIQQGDTEPLVVDCDHRIVNGHHRYDAYQQLGYHSVPVIQVLDADVQELCDRYSHKTSDQLAESEQLLSNINESTVKNIQQHLQSAPVKESNTAEQNTDAVRFSVSSESNFERGLTVSMMVDGKPAGSFRYHMDFDEGAQHSVEIHGDYRRRGYGTLLLLKAIETAVDQMGEFQSDIRGITAAQEQLYHKAQEQGLITSLGLGTYDITDRGLEMLGQAQGLAENFADGKVKGKSRPGRAKRAGVDCGKSITDLRKMAKNSSGEKQKMAHWCANMKSGRKKKS